MRRVWSAFAALVAAISLAVPIPPAAASIPAAGALSRLADRLPNYFIEHHRKPSPLPQDNSTIQTLYNPRLDRFYEFSNYECYPHEMDRNTAVYDMETYRLVRTGCVNGLRRGRKAANGAALIYDVHLGTGSGSATVAALDLKDGLIFAPAFNFLPESTRTDQPQVAVFDADTLALRDVWTLPLTAPQRLTDLSWYAPTNELLVTTSWFGQSTAHPEGAIALYDYDVTATLHRADPAGTNRIPARAWEGSVRPCVNEVFPELGTVGAHRSERRPDRVYVPCQVAYAVQSGHGVPTYRAGVVVLKLAPCLTGSGAICPQVGSETVAVAPSNFQGFLFDPDLDRAFAPNNAISAGISLLVYDGLRGDQGREGEFAGRTSVGASANSLNATSTGLDPRTGRVYAATPGGLTLVDGRRTELGGISYPKLGGNTNRIDIAVVPPSMRHPYTRLVVPYQECPVKGYCALFRFTVLADRLPVTVDPPISDRDRSTYRGSLAGRTFTTDYSGDASGYGVHVDWVGSADAALGNASGNQEQVDGARVPFGGGSRDLLSGYVNDARLDNGSAGAAATALGDGQQSSTKQGFETTTGQPWPYATVECGYPGTGDPHAETGNPLASAQVTCNARAPENQLQVIANSFYGAANVSAPPVTVAIGAAHTEANVTAPKDATTGVVSEVRATVSGLHITLDGGAEIVLGEVTQHAVVTANGRPGGARVKRDPPRLTSVSVTVLGQRVPLCESVCDTQKVIDQLNTAFGQYVRIFQPDPDPAMLRGSPGGFTAGVIAQPWARHGDIQFNLMTADEAPFVPALRIVAYDDGDAVARLIVDLAGIKADAQLGVDVDEVFRQIQTVDDKRQQELARQYAAPPPLLGPNVGGPGLPPATTPGGIGGVIVRAFRGFAFLFRRPGELVSVAAMLGILLAPALLMARRRLWTRDVFADVWTGSG